MSDPDYRYELFFELSPDLLCIAGFDGYFKKINPAVSKLLGYTMDELYSRPINDFVYHEDKDVTAQARAALTRSRPLYNFENRYVTKSGAVVWLSWTSFPLEEEKLIFAIAKHITHRKKLDAERNTLLADLTETNKDLKQLTYTTSHDLRSPVNNLLSLFKMIDTTKISDQETTALIDVLKQAGDRLKQTLDKYVDVLSEKHSANDGMETVVLQDVLDDVLESISSLVQVAKASVSADFSALPAVTFNRSYLESIFLNLITNAIKYARPDRSPVIAIRSETVDGASRLIVADNGRGFDVSQVQGKLFGLHQQFHNYTDSKGIGLYLVYNHVTRLGGKIDVESGVDEGTTFTITFKS